MGELAPLDRALPGQLVVKRSAERDTVLLSLEGEFDLASAPSFERELTDAESTRPQRLVIDLSRLSFMDSTGLRALLVARKSAEANGHRLSLRRAPFAVRRVFELTNTLDIFTFED